MRISDWSSDVCSSDLLGKAAIKKPAQQRRSLCIVYRIKVIAERLLHPWPVRHGSTDFGKCRADIVDEPATPPRVRSIRFKVDDRLVLRAVAARRRYAGQHALLVTNDRYDRMDQPVNRNSLCRKCRRYRIDEERHVIVDDRQPHQPSIADTFQRLQGNDRFSDCTNANCTRQKSGRVLASLLVESLILPRQRSVTQGGRHRVNDMIGIVPRGFGGHDPSFPGASAPCSFWRSEEHTSEFQSPMRISYDVLYLKQKKTTNHIT